MSKMTRHNFALACEPSVADHFYFVPKPEGIWPWIYSSKTTLLQILFLKQCLAVSIPTAVGIQRPSLLSPVTYRLPEKRCWLIFIHSICLLRVTSKMHLGSRADVISLRGGGRKRTMPGRPTMSNFFLLCCGQFIVRVLWITFISPIR